MANLWHLSRSLTGVNCHSSAAQIATAALIGWESTLKCFWLISCYVVGLQMPLDNFLAAQLKPNLQSGVSIVLPLIHKPALDAFYLLYLPTSASGFGTWLTQEHSAICINNVQRSSSSNANHPSLYDCSTVYLPVCGVLTVCGMTLGPPSSGWHKCLAPWHPTIHFWILTIKSFCCWVIMVTFR